jgi:hypothetical protein
MQGPVFGFNVSGASEWSDKLVHQVAIGLDLITGVAYGEGSVVVIAFRFVVLALVILATHRVTKFATTSLRSPRQKATAELQEQSKM